VGQTEFRVLGALEVVDGGKPVPLGSGRQAMLVSRLLLSANEVVTRDELIDALWGEQPMKTSRNLQVHVHALRKRLGAEGIVTEGPGYRLHVGPGELDRERFERLVAQGRKELGSGVAEEAAAAHGGSSDADARRRGLRRRLSSRPGASDRSGLGPGVRGTPAGSRDWLSASSRPRDRLATL
jgi:DNA-binding SARP family transcriptional activator